MRADVTLLRYFPFQACFQIFYFLTSRPPEAAAKNSMLILLENLSGHGGAQGVWKTGQGMVEAK
jgi:preprotein translocase subunit YajC